MSASKVTFQDRLTKVGLRVWAFLLIVSALILAANFGAAAFFAGQINSASALSFGLQVDAQKLGRYATEAIAGREEAFAELQGTRDAIVTAIAEFNRRRRMAALAEHAGQGEALVTPEELQQQRRRG